MKEEITEAQWLQEHDQIPVEQLAQLTGLAAEVLRELVDYGALTPSDPQSVQWTFDAACIDTLCAARRLQDDFELDAKALSITLTLIGQIRRLEVRLQELKSQLPDVRHEY